VKCVDGTDGKCDSNLSPSHCDDYLNSDHCLTASASTISDAPCEFIQNSAPNSNSGKCTSFSDVDCDDYLNIEQCRIADIGVGCLWNTACRNKVCSDYSHTVDKPCSSYNGGSGAKCVLASQGSSCTDGIEPTTCSQIYSKNICNSRDFDYICGWRGDETTGHCASMIVIPPTYEGDAAFSLVPSYFTFSLFVFVFFIVFV
jgi:hypothetical protein